jgi:molybdopterin synthase sulfur carrier subunit
MPRIILKLYAELRRFSDGKPSLEVEFAEGATIAQVMEQYRIPLEQTRLIFVDGRAARGDDVLQGGEKVEVFSAVGGG